MPLDRLEKSITACFPFDLSANARKLKAGFREYNVWHAT